VRRPKRSEEEKSDRGDREINVENVNIRVVVVVVVVIVVVGGRGQVYEGFKLGTAFQDPAVHPSAPSSLS